MRVKSDEKRQAIKAAAEAVFGEIGYERASMSAIAARFGGSKATLYSYFKSKEELFTAVMIEAVTDHADKVLELLNQDTADLRQTLIALGHAYLDLVLSDDAMTIIRNGIIEAKRAPLGRVLYDQGPGYGWRLMAERMVKWQEQGLITCPNPNLAALHLKALLEAGLMEPLMYGADFPIDRSKAPEAAVDVFLSYYGTKAG